MAARKKTGTAVAVKRSTSMANVEAEMAAAVSGIKDQIGTPATNQIKTTGKIFTLPDGSVIDGPMEVVIIDFISQNKFYPGKYDPNNIVPPDCFAIGKILADMKPSPNSLDPQATSCAECTMNVFGSDGNGKACKNARLLAILPPDATSEDEIMTIAVSPTALKGFDSYVNAIASKYKAPPVKVITTIDFHPTPDYPQLTFMDTRPNEDFAAYWARREEAQTLLTAEPDMTAALAEAAAPKPKKRPAARRRA